MLETACTEAGLPQKGTTTGGCPAELFLTLDEVVHQRTRLAVLCVLRWRGELDFNTLRDALALSDGNLARHITVLRAADLVETAKRTEGRRRRTYICTTKQGFEALNSHVEAMAEIVRAHHQLAANPVTDQAI